MRLIEQIGSYAGLAAIPGLAVLSALYFSQARDVRRLREWAGRAPERAAEQAMGGRPTVQPQQVAQPGLAQPASAAQTAEKPAVGAGAAAGGPAVAKPAALTPAAVASAAAGATKAPPTAGAAAASAGAGGGSATGTVTRPGPPAVAAGRPATGGALPPRREIPRVPSAQTSVLGPTARAREPWYRRLADRLPAGRYVALIVAGALVLGGAAAFGISQLSSSDSSGSKPSASKQAPSSGSRDKPAPKKENVRAAPAIDPSKVTVTVVNGTTIPNLARDTAGKLSALGFKIGNTVTGTGSLAAAESVVEYKPGFEDEARYVAAKLHISQKQPADPDAVAQAGPAGVIAVLGADRAPGG
ncbi:MAG: hypothetical protein QOH76_1893 [Thermoleophilaceae bacterium]|jgi:hypothetical protein|nr:hypothetical protein [Thermoleophilaceae bacterium]